MLEEKKIYLLSVLVSCFFIALTQQAGFINILIYFVICYMGMSYIHCNYYGGCILNIHIFILLFILLNIVYVVFFFIFDIIIPKHSKILLSHGVFNKQKKYINILDPYIKV